VTLDPLDIALEATVRGELPDPAAWALVRRQERLIAVQTLGERFGLALKGLMALAGVLAAIALVFGVWEASRYRGLVIEAFSVPPDLAARGLTGEAVAALVLDDLVAIQGAADSIRAPDSYDNDWSRDVEIEIPQTGLSLGDVQRVLRGYFGRETRISGSVYRQADGRLVVAARTSGGAGRRFVGQDAELEALLRQAAESIFGHTQPYRYTVYLRLQGRGAESAPLYRRFEGGTDREAAWMYRGWAFEMAEEGRYREGLEKARYATRIQPDLAVTWSALAQMELSVDHPEEALAAADRGLDLLRAEGSGDITPEARLSTINRLQLYRQGLLGDHLGAWRDDQSQARYGATAADVMLSRADRSVSARELAQARTQLSAARPGADASTSARAAWHEISARYAAELEDWPAAIAHWREAMALRRAGAEAAMADVWTAPGLVEGLVGAGRLEEAGAVAAAMPADCYSCLMARGDLAAARGRFEEADGWFDQAVKRAPSIPYAWARRGQARERRGDIKGARADYRKAQRLGPQWADGYLFEARLLMRSGRPLAALPLFARAARRAPSWGKLHLEWAAALDAAGKRDEALVQWRRASSLPLSAADRARTARRLPGAG
jgi:tetratricopeptide (TPR) repeat protein